MSQTLPVSPALLPNAAAASHAAATAADPQATDDAPTGFAAALSTAALRHASAKAPEETGTEPAAPGNATDPATALPLADWVIPWIAPVAAAMPAARAAPADGATVALTAWGGDPARAATGGAAGRRDSAATTAEVVSFAPVAADGDTASALPLTPAGVAADSSLPSAARPAAGTAGATDALLAPARSPVAEGTAAAAPSAPAASALAVAPTAPAPIDDAGPAGSTRPADPVAPAKARSDNSGATIAAAPAPSAKAAAVEVAAAREPVARVADGAPAAGIVAGSTTTIAPREAAAPVFAVATPVAAPGWHDDVAKGLAHVVSLRLTDAEIRLNPAHLGPVGIEITYSDNQASVLVTAAQPATRDALEQALPQLKELLAQQGITLGESAVRGEAQSRSDPDPAASARVPRKATETVDRSGTIPGEPEVARGGRPAGRIDTFA